MTLVMRHRAPPLQFSVRPVPPFRLDLTVWALRRRARNLVDRWDGSAFRRVVVMNGRPTELVVRQSGAPAAPRLVVTAIPAPRTDADRQRLRRSARDDREVHDVRCPPQRQAQLPPARREDVRGGYREGACGWARLTRTSRAGDIA